MLTELQSGTFFKIVRRGSEIRWEPDSIPFAANREALPDIEYKDPYRLLDAVQHTIVFSHNVHIRSPFEPLPDTFPTFGKLVIRVAHQIVGSYSEKRRLHRPGWNFEWLQKERPDRHSDRERHQQHF